MSVTIRSLHLGALFGLFVAGSACAQTTNPNDPPVDPNFRLPGQMPGQRAIPPNSPPAFLVPQVPSSPYLTPVQPSLSMPTASLSTPYLGGTGTGSLVNNYPPPYNPYNPYNNPYYPSYDPYGGAFTGYANLISAVAQSNVTLQNARLVQQQANQAMIDTRRRLFDQIRYERMSIPTPEEVRVHDMEVALNRARRNPPLVEIWSGVALNDLLKYLIKQQGAGMRGPRIDLDEDMLRHINVNTGGSGNAGLLKDGVKLLWPLSMQRTEYAEARKTLSALLQEAVQQVQFNNTPSPNILKDIQTALQSLNDTLNREVNAANSDLTASQYIEARRYLNQLNDGFKALQDPNAPNYFNKKYSARGKTVAELIKNMDTGGLWFAPASQGDEGPYRALYNALTAYDSSMLATRP
jgi:hypothetical protein